MRITRMQESISAPSRERSVIDHAANEPESANAGGRRTSCEELERSTCARAYFEDHDPTNAATDAIPRAPCWSQPASASLSLR